MGLIQSKSRASLGFGAPAVEAPLPCFSCDRPKRQPLPQSLLETCVRCIAKNLDELAERIAAWNVNALPVDLIQAVFDELVALRQLTPRLAMLFEHQFFDRLELDAYPGATCSRAAPWPLQYSAQPQFCTIPHCCSGASNFMSLLYQYCYWRA